MMTERRALGALVLMMAMVVAGSASAHSGNTKTAEVMVTADQVEVTLVADATVAADEMELDVELDDEEVAERSEAVSAWLTRGIEVRRAGVACPALVGGEPVLTERGVEVQVDFACGQGERLELTDGSLADEPGHRTVVALEGKTTVLRASSPTAMLSAPPTWGAVATTFLVEGVIHLVTGYDHVLFLLALLFAAGVVAREQGRRVAMKEVALVVTAFTVGHSITLALAALELVTLNLRFVESVIAASIVVAAIMNLRRAAAGRPWLALVFGLIHGFGFSSVLADVGLPSHGRAVALGSFNLGIELAQLGVVLLAVPLLAWLAKRERLYRRAVMHGGSVAIAALACFWLVERALGL